MQNIHKIQISVSAIMLAFVLAFFAFTSTTFAQSADHTGTLRICSVLTNSTGALTSADATVPVGTFALSLATTTDFLFPITTHTFNAQAFAHNTTVEGIAMHCTDTVTVPFGQYYYNNVSMSGPTWAPVKYFDSTSAFLTADASLYTDGLFTADSSDDVLINTTSDGLVVVDETYPDRTVIVLSSYNQATTVGNPNLHGEAPQCMPGVNIVTNGGFEFPVVTLEKKWDIIPFSTLNLGWISRDQSGYGLEIQAGIFDGFNTWLAQEGTQYAEIDGGKYHEVAQNLDTVVGKTYTLTFWTSPRPHLDSSINQMNLFINDVFVDTLIASGTPVNVWSKNTYTFTANSSVTRVSFVDVKENSTGTALYLDNVSVTCDGVVHNMCVVPSTLGDTAKVTVENRNLEINTLQKMLDTFNMGLDQVQSQKNYQTFGLSQASTTLEVSYVDTGAGAPLVFGYHTSGNATSFVPIFKTGEYVGFENVPVLSKGQKILVNVLDKSSISFGIKSGDVNSPFFSTETALNADGVRHALVYDVSTAASAAHLYAVAFEDLTGLGDHDYNDILVTVGFAQCSVKNTPPVNPPVHQCVLPDTFGDTVIETIGTSYLPEPTVAQITAAYGMSIDTTSDQKQYQSWTLSPTATTSITIKYMGGATAGENVFGYYVNNDISTFAPLFSSGTGADTGYASTSRATDGQIFTLSLKASSVQFAIKSLGSAGEQITSSVNAENHASSDRVITFNTPGATSHNDFVVAFEDMPVSTSDNDYNDVVVQVTVTGCVSAPVLNTPPTITLVGSNPIMLTVGGTFTDPGATANDLEDGIITNKIVVTGTVNSQTSGTYVLTYTVTDSGGLSASTMRTVVVLPVVVEPPVVPPVNACMIVSDTTNTIVGGGNAVATYNGNSAWTASIPGATWIWSTYKVVDPAATTTVVFSKTFTATSTLPHAVLSIASDNSFIVKVNGTVVAQNLGEFNYAPVATYDIASAIVAGTNTITFEVTNFPRPGTTPEVNPAGLLYSLDLSNNGTVVGCAGTVVVNTPPTITLIGANPAALTVGQAWVEPGATATDIEDGNITDKIVITGTVNINAVGTYPLVYTVTDSGGLSASTTRQVIVSPAGGGGVTTGAITFCSIYANKDNVVATSSTGLPSGTFIIKLASSTDIGNSTLHSKTWTASAFAPNKKVISTFNDADCVTYSDLVFGTYYYSELGVTGQQWIVSTTSPRYNDQLTTPVNNIFDFFAYSPALFTATTTDDVNRNVNSDGQIVLSADRREHTLVMVTQYDAATTTPPVEPPACTSNCGGGPSTPPACSANCGGGGGGGNGPIVSSLAITNEKVVEITPGVALVTWNTNLPATKEVGYGNTSQPASFIVSPFGYTHATARVSNPLSTIHSYTIAIESGKTYYFRPVSTDGKTTVAGIELVLNPGTGTGGGGNGGTGGTPSSCYYLFDWLKKGWNNNPVEVKKLQVFLRDLEGYPVLVTGVYDDQTITSLNAFQMRYKADVLTPWGHTAPTSFTYITTKKKVNEIYCKMAFPVTAQEQAEIDAFRAFLLGLQAAGVTITPPTQEQIDAPVFIDTTEVGVLPGISTSTPGMEQGTLAGAEANSTSAIGQLTANVIASSKKIGNFMAALFTWPWDWAKGWFGGNDDLECAPTSVFSNWFNWILVIIILTMAYLWYRERRESKKAAKLNEELELLNK